MNCTMERLTVLDGNSTSTPLIGPTCNGRNAPDTYVRTASNLLTVQFASNSSVAVSEHEMLCNRNHYRREEVVSTAVERNADSILL